MGPDLKKKRDDDEQITAKLASIGNPVQRPHKPNMLIALLIEVIPIKKPMSKWSLTVPIISCPKILAAEKIARTAPPLGNPIEVA